ncbi:hypothetical protein EGW08_010310 [Elysia chlorotica]|uniref:DUF4211 domain-containing protein n=1 Tax=Elysia chlorotica TaxID=188477 RepID=A0A433TK53_ELYCH|nr:hypothetical protein EGW08_010310 [Elysia chlorotica]
MEVQANGAKTGDAAVVKLESETLAGSETGAADSPKRKADALQEDNVENGDHGSPAKRGRGAAARGRGRPRGRGRGAGDSNVLDKTARIVLKQVDAEGQDGDRLNTSRGSPRQRGRGRGARGVSRGSATVVKTSSGRVRKPTSKVKEEVDEENEGDEDPEEDTEDDDEDKDPDEEPSEEDIEEDEDEEEEFFPPSKRGRGRGKNPSTPGRGRGRGGRGRGRGKSKASPGKAGSKEVDDDEDEMDEEAEDAEMDAAEEAEAVSNDPDAIRTGQFLIDKRDIRHPENFPIWRMEGPNMLRKFEMIVQLGRIRHRSLYAYSSWAQTMKDLFNKIEISQISSADGEIVVEINDQYLPKAPDLQQLEDKYRNHEHLQLFSTMLSILFQQVANPDFLANAYSQDDAVVKEPMSQIDTMVRERIKQIEAAVNFKEEFKIRISDCPNMKSIRRSNWSQTDQSTLDRVTEKGVRSVLLFGFGYDLSTMAEDKTRGAEVASEIVIGETTEKYLMVYHGVTHLKFHLLRRCHDKAKLLELLQGEKPSIEKCMEDRGWMLAAFEEFVNLFTPEETVAASS